jgi:DNA-binding response OmpR family regulator
VVLFSRFVVNRIALVEDHERVAALICKAFEGTGIQVEVFDRIARSTEVFRTAMASSSSASCAQAAA